MRKRDRIAAALALAGAAWVIWDELIRCPQCRREALLRSSRRQQQRHERHQSD